MRYLASALLALGVLAMVVYFVTIHATGWAVTFTIIACLSGYSEAK